MSIYVQQEKISGVVERITFHSIETGWSVLKVSPFNGPSNLVTVLIHQAKVFAGSSMDFYGSWTTHKKYGEQFKATKSIEKKPASAAALEKYLGSGLIKGVGPKTARKIVRFFGKRTLEVFEEKIEELLKVPSIAEKKLTHIRASWEEHRAIRDVMMFLQSHGVSTLFAVKIFKEYRNDAIQIVSDNPYRLSRDIYGIGFYSADRVALKLGFGRDSKERVQAGIKHVLAASRDEGHCYLMKDQIFKNTLSLLELENEKLIEISLEDLLAENEIMLRKIRKKRGDVLDCYYSKSLYWDEAYIGKKVKLLMSKKRVIDKKRVHNWINKYFKKSSLFLSDEQSESVIGIVEEPLSILTGGPGCGKTTSVSVLVKLLQAMKKKVLLAAPTGRAAQRMSEVMGYEAKTIHRLLEWEPHKGGFKKGEDSPLQADFLIVDECSMLDVTIAASLLKAVPRGCQLLFIGDPNQLPSVGAGSVLGDLLSSQKVPHFRLTRIFRQAEESCIIKYAHDINKGQTPKIISPLARPQVWKESQDCLFIDADEASQEQLKFVSRARNIISRTLNEGTSHILKSGEKSFARMKKVEDHIEVEKLFNPIIDEEKPTPDFVIPDKFRHVDLENLSSVSNELEELKGVLKSIHPWSSVHFGLTARDVIRRLYMKTIRENVGKNCEIQILTPQVRGSLGALSLNKLIQEAINPNREGQIQIQMGERLFRVGDRVIQTRNNYDLNVFNGDIGSITYIDSDDYSCHVQFGKKHKPIEYRKEDLAELSLAYAITIHKSQGSEFEAVIIPVMMQHFKMLFRNLIYTGLTRAKKMAIFVGSRKALALCVKRIDNQKRQTALDELLRG